MVCEVSLLFIYHYLLFLNLCPLSRRFPTYFCASFEPTPIPTGSPTVEPTPSGPSREPTATPSAWIEGCCSGIDNIDDSWCAQFENGPDCEANPQCWWIDGGMRFPIMVEADNDGINITTHSPTVSPTDPTAFPSQIPSNAPSRTPTWYVLSSEHKDGEQQLNFGN